MLLNATNAIKPNIAKRQKDMAGFSLKAVLSILLLILLMLCHSFEVCEARRGKHWRQKRLPASSLTKKKGKGQGGGGPGHKNHHGGSGGKTNPAPMPSPSPSHNSIYDVLDFGAKGDGVTDDTKAFEEAWTAACQVEASTVKIPSDYTFLVGPISFSGPYCQPNIIFQLDGTIVAPTNSKVWSPGLLWWIEFTKLKGITIQGRGTIEGRGSVWWTQSEPDNEPINEQLGMKMPSIKPTALRFYGSYNVTVTGITIQNSPQCHLKFDNCEAVHVFNMSVTSPGDSLNTDGIHLQNSKDVAIHHCNLSCGDDCVSMQTGCNGVKIHDVNCGPGHGISIGGLGRDDTKACVSNITVQDVNMYGTMTGVRIKTWQGGSGSVQSIRFSNIRVSEVQTPIVIDQFYCDRSSCKNQTTAVALSSIAYESIKGTYTVKPVHLACSDNTPCSDISLTEIELQPMQEHYHMYDPFCWQAFGELYTPTVPPIPCLQNGKPTSNRILSDHDVC
ncbi:polygalacturonase At1g48100-like [Phalaenopsis equestris]|uniref:polygalacturonase At1g48100-like n=1 Tax=Phalaenopsis equestris TaxID=78828 RepID=UPI0009E31A70|nr:polygalacturonase At1g48100-like [Phalaenopsis equestris]